MLRLNLREQQFVICILKFAIRGIVMSPVVVDVGNTRIKWGLCDDVRVCEVAALAPDEENAWQAQWQAWSLSTDTTWIVSGVHPARLDALVQWLGGRGSDVQVLSSHRQLPIEIALEMPEKVGIDRLLNAVAANERRSPGAAAALVDAGSAVTVDYVDAAGVFRGGAIFPGLRLMARSLHDYTALLPIVPMETVVEPPGVTTVGAIQTGIFHAVVGGIERLIGAYERRSPAAMEIYLTGGDAAALSVKLPPEARLWPEMTLAGILHSQVS
jgi:type III pantothenate kinase